MSAVTRVLGSVLSMHQRDKMPLVVFLWSFLLAVANLLLIHMGENMASGTGYPIAMGLGVLWIGNVVVAVSIAWVYCRLARN